MLETLNSSGAPGKFTGRLDMAQLGVFGHSFGWATAAEFCSQDFRCKAGIHKPFMFLLSDHSDSTDAVSRQILSNIESVYDRLPADRRLKIAIRGANHFTFSDDGVLLKSRVVRGVLHLFGKLAIEGSR